MYLVTPRLIIEPFSQDLITDKYVSWLNDPLVVKNSRQRHKVHDLEQCKAYFLSFSNSDNFFLSIKHKSENSIHIGNITISNDNKNRVSDISILIGEKKFWGQGIGLEAWSAVMSYLLTEMGVRKVTGGCYASNESMKKIMINSGMQPDGVRKNQILLDDTPVDILYFAKFKINRGMS